ncbi:Glutamate receptor 3.3-like protein [Drosera capensis]
MKILLFLELFLLFRYLFLNVGTGKNVPRPTEVNVGALFTFESTIGRVAKVAIQEAVKDVNDDPTILSHTKLNVIMRSSNCNGFIGTVQALQFMETKVLAIIGPQSSVVAHIISHAASELQVPLLSFAATDPTITPLEFPLFVRTTQSDSYQMTAIADIIKYYGWKKVTVIFVDDDYGRNGMSALDDALNERRCKISYKVGIRPGTGVSRSEIMDILVKVAMVESRVIVLHVNPSSGFTILRVANYLQMMGNGYVWISSDWLSSVLDSSIPHPPEMEGTMHGVIVLRQHTPDSTRKSAFISRWRNLTGGAFGLNSYGLYAYDSVWLIAHAIDAFLNQGGIISYSNDSKLTNLKGNNLHLDAMSIFDGGKRLLENILQADVMGLTGRLKFDPDRSLVHPAYDILNVIGTGYHQIGYWSNHSGLSTRPPETLYTRPPNHSGENQQLNSVIWPGGTTTVPRGWVLPDSGKKLKIGVPIVIGCPEYVSRVPGSDNLFTGFCIDVFIAAIDLMPYGVPYEFVGYGDGHENPSYSDLVAMVASGDFDAAIGDISIVTRRTKFVDFTQPYAESGLVVVAPYKTLNSGPWTFLQPFTPLTWCVILAFFIVVGVVIWILEHRVNEEFRGSPAQQLATTLWFSFSTLTFTHRENTESAAGKAVLLMWLFVVLILTSSYTASLTSILTVKKLSSPIDGIDSLMAGNQHIGYQHGSYSQQYLIKELNISENRLIPFNSPEDYGAALQDGHIDAVVDELPYVELFITRQCKFRIVGQEFTRSGWGFAFPRDSPLAPDMSTSILRLIETGDLDRIRDKWVTKNSCDSQNDAEIQSTQFELKSFLGLFLISGIACLLSICIFFAKLSLKFGHTSRVRQDSSPTRRLRTLLSLIDEKKDTSKIQEKSRNDEESVTS